MNLRKTSLFTLAFMLSFSLSFAQTDNRIVLKKGQKYVIENITKTSSTTAMQGMPMEVAIDATTFYEIEVADSKNDQYNLTNTIKKVKMKISQMGQEMDFDSEKEVDLNGPIGDALKNFINVPQKVILSQQGKISSDSSNKSAEINSALGDYESTGFGASLAFQALPKNLKVNQTWEVNTNESGSIKKTIYTVKSINGDLATLTLSGKMDVNTTMENMGMEITTKSQGEFSGEEIVHIKTGVIQSQKMDITTEGIVEVMGQELPNSSKITSTTTVKMM
ncbi:MAG: DUF6263 family protein [Ginsengibacter sp.]